MICHDIGPLFIFNSLALFSFCSTCSQNPPQALVAFLMPVHSSCILLEKREKLTIVIIGPTFNSWTQTLCKPSALPGDRAVFLLCIHSPTRQDSCFFAQPSSSHLPSLHSQLRPCSLFHWENRKHPFFLIFWLPNASPYQYLYQVLCSPTCYDGGTLRSHLFLPPPSRCILGVGF